MSEDRPLHLERSNTRAGPLLTVALALVAGVVFWFYWSAQRAPVVQQPAAEAPPAAAAPAPIALAPTPQQASEPDNATITRHPIEPAAPAHAPAMDSDARWRAALIDLVGTKALAWLRVDGFAERTALTVDSLARSFAPPRRWPIHPMAGRFAVATLDGKTVIARENSSRYDGFVTFVEQVDAVRAAALYRKVYPVLQGAYEHLGHSGRYFNDRLVELIDLLLATPISDGPLEVSSIEVKTSAGAPALERPWLHYQFADPALESLAAGQKMLLRAGPANARRLKAKLVTIRSLVASPS